MINDQYFVFSMTFCLQVFCFRLPAVGRMGAPQVTIETITVTRPLKVSRKIGDQASSQPAQNPNLEVDSSHMTQGPRQRRPQSEGTETYGNNFPVWKVTAIHQEYLNIPHYTFPEKIHEGNRSNNHVGKLVLFLLTTMEQGRISTFILYLKGFFETWIPG